MKTVPAMLLSTGAALFAVSCYEKPTANNAEATAPEAGVPAAAVSGHGSGTVTALDKTAGKVAIQHGPIPEAGWPAMTMSFEANTAALKGIKLGDKVQFDMTMAGGVARVTSIKPQ